MTSIPGGAGVTSGKNQLTSASAAGYLLRIYQRNQSIIEEIQELQPIDKVTKRSTAQYPLPVAAVPLPVNLPINSKLQNFIIVPKD